MKTEYCKVDTQTEFGKTLTEKARSITHNPKTNVFGRCAEIEELNAGQRTRLSTWYYTLSLEEAKKHTLEKLPLTP